MEIFLTTSSHFSKDWLFLLKFFLALMLSEIFHHKLRDKGRNAVQRNEFRKSDIKQERKKKPDFPARFTNQYTRGTQRECSSKTLKHSIV